MCFLSYARSSSRCVALTPKTCSKGRPCLFWPFLSTLVSIAAQPEKVACIEETNHGLLITFLLEAGIPVYPLNPKTANQLGKAAGARARSH